MHLEAALPMKRPPKEFVANPHDRNSQSPPLNYPRNKPKQPVLRLYIGSSQGLADFIYAIAYAPHNSRDYYMLKRKQLEDLLYRAKRQRVFNAVSFDYKKVSDDDLDHLMKALPQLLDTKNNSFKLSG